MDRRPITNLTLKENSMKSTDRNDYRVFVTTNHVGVTRYEIRAGGEYGHRVTSCRTLAAAEFQAVQLNIDPYYFEKRSVVSE